ncbi:DUF3883 domain-containing protein [Cellulomonas cellasea]|uniref:Protein NO VEIN C-terminal domain-containing protein n=1 Tax=Cellulomonas cellasea TaxID=43670 RepID=A0A7W4UGI1_9CELL|nr:DUF3883 domain-containing protein [Cellulomonas cellasea]MBB2923758.1 hypothetical protein [Cellulomonas cellasea]
MSLVAHLTGTELDSIRAEVAAGRVAHTLKSLDERGGAQELVRQQYSGRYPFELMQNAADAAAEAGRMGRVRFHLSAEALLVADNGTGFGDEQIESICSLGRSSKSPAKSVGYKGLGFKSVGEITERPQIISAGARFEFDDTRVVREVSALTGQLPAGQRLPTYAFPFDVDDAVLGDDGPLVAELLAEGYQTVMRLPLRAGVGRDDVEKHLMDNVAPQLMLFLYSLEELRLTGTTDEFCAFVTREPDGGAEVVLLEADGTNTEWLVYSRRLPVSAELVAPLGEGWKQVESVTTAVAVPLGPGGPATGEAYPLHVYFPTDEAGGFAFIAHADWALHLDRRQLATTPESAAYNQALTAAVIDLLCQDVAADLAERFDDPVVPAAVLAPRGTPTGAGAELHRQLLAALKDVPFVATADAGLRMAREVEVLPPKRPDVLEFHAHADVTVRPSVAHPGIETDPRIREFVVKLGARTVPLEAALAMLRPPTQQNMRDYYEHLINWDAQVGRNAFRGALASLPCVLTRDGRVVTPKSRVFFPRTNDAIAIDLPLPIAVLPDDVEGLEAMLGQAGVSAFDWRYIVPEFLVPILTDPAQDEHARTKALDGLRAYVRSRRSGDGSLRSGVTSVLVPARAAADDHHTLAAANAVYFGAEWTGNTHLEDIYGPFEKAEFLDVPVPVDSDERAIEREFWSFLGVADSPRVLSVDTGIVRRYSNWPWAHPHAHDPLWTAWLAEQAVDAAQKCPQGHPASQHLSTSHLLDRFSELVVASDDRRLRALWASLAERWGTVYEPAMSAVFRCAHGSHAGDSNRRVMSLLRYALLVSEWVPARRDRTVVLVAPGQAWRVASGTPKHIRRRVPRLDDTLASGGGAKLINDLGVTDAARLTADALFDLLRELAQESPHAEPGADLVKAAQWSLRALDDAVRGGHHDAPNEPLSLLSTIGGAYTFATDPIVVRNPLLREACGADRAVLAADDDLRALPQLLNLVVLDDKVHPTPREYGPRPELVEVVQQHIEGAKPWMLALLRKLRPSAEEDFVRRMRRLDVRPCNELLLEYEYGGQVHPLADAVSHIATRTEPSERSGAFGSFAGTAYLEVDQVSGVPRWYDFGPQLAAYVRAENYGDQFGHLLACDDAARAQIMAAKRISRDDVRTAAEILGHAEHFDTDDLVDFPLDGDASSGAHDDGEGGRETQGGQEDGGGARPATSPRAPSTPPRTSTPPAGNPTGTAGGSAATGTDGTSGPTGAGIEPGGSSTGAPAELPELALDEIMLEDSEPGPAASGARGGGPGGGGYGGAWTPEPMVSDLDKRALGRRGELAALAAERRHVATFRSDAGHVVVHRSDLDQYAPHDIESVDEHGVSVFIEVKSTTGTDPCAPFDISQAELTQAIRYGSKYRVYRVTSVRSSTPTVTRYLNPISHVLEGNATLDLSKARMRFGREE